MSIYSAEENFLLKCHINILFDPKTIELKIIYI